MSRKYPKTTKPEPWLSPIDKLTLAYCGWIIVYMLIGIGLGRAIEPEIHLPVYLSLFTLVFLMSWTQRNLSTQKHPKLAKALSLLRSIYPLFLFGYFYTKGYAVNRILFTEWQDPYFMRIDKLIFGYYPSLVWGIKYSHWFWQELFHFAYFCYYPMIIGLPLYLYFKNKRAFDELIFALCFVFYLCYTIYSLLPVIGGRYFPEAMELTKIYRGGPFTHIMAFIYNRSGHLGGAFPSSHVGVTMVLTIGALRYVRAWGYLFCVIAFFLSIATVYCHYHWFIDAVAGIFIGILGYYLAGYVRSKLQRDPL